jgi:hypothetical protein
LDAQTQASNNKILLGVFFTLITCIPSHCLATKRGINFIGPLPSNNRRDTHTDTQTDGREL